MNLSKSTSYKFDFNRLTEFQELTGVNPFQLSESDIMNPKTLRALCYCGLKDRKNITIEDVGDSLNVSDLEAVTAALMRDMGADMGEKKETP